MDRRKNKTRKAIFAAFEEVISEKRYEQITVQDIIDRADIGRTTFYAHFETKDSVLEAICAELFAHIFGTSPKAEADHDFSQGENTLAEKMNHILYHLQEDKKRYKRLFSSESAERFWAYFRIWATKKLGSEIETQMVKKKRNVPKEFYKEFFVSTFIETVRWWFNEGCKTKPKVVGAYFNEVS